VREVKKEKTLIPTFSRKREKEHRCVGLFLSPLAGEGRVRAFFL
jgi:hypothetical protein